MAAYDPLVVPLKMRLGAPAARRLQSLGLETVGDALQYAPRRYFRWGKLTDLRDLTEGDDVTILARVDSVSLVKNRSGSGVRLLVRVSDGAQSLTCTFFAKNPYALTHHQRLLKEGETFLFAGKVSSYQGQMQLIQPSFEEVEPDGAIATQRRAGRPIPIYKASAKTPSWKVSALLQQVFDSISWDQVPETLPESVRQEHGLLSQQDAYRLLHSPQDDVDWQNARRTLAWSEALELQVALRQPRVLAQEGHHAHPLVPQSDSVQQLLAGLPFELTGAQQAAWEEISADLEQTEPMQRLLQADVGAGKTVVALLAMVQAVDAGAQAALLAPTEVLAQQHFKSLQKLLGESGVPLHLLTASTPSSVRGEVLARLAAGEPGIVVGTHALLQESVDIANLQLLVVDEQHRFGVQQREYLREGRDTVPHLLVMTATPIPRTIAMTVFGDLDVTAMTELPAGRTPVTTYQVPQDRPTWVSRVWQLAREEISAGNRVYVVCPRIDEDPDLPSIESVRAQLASEPSLEGIRVGVAHGRQSAEENARALADFASGEAPLLLATTVVEVGVDVPEATMMIIMGAQQFGISQLHQLRGRVGRSDKPSVAMLVHPEELNSTALERLKTVAQTSDGFALAEADLKLRSEGDVLGQTQSGHRSSLQFLSLRRDGAIIAAAREEAAKILENDPQLLNHEGLREAAQRRTGEQIVWLERS